MSKYAVIIERIEFVRKYLGLKKSRFSSNIGMKPQTYNNFIGAQGSKPSVDLIHGIVAGYGVNPTWLLNGTGEVFSEEAKLSHAVDAGPVHIGDSLANKFSKSLNEMQLQLKSLDPALSQTENRIRELKSSQHLLIEGLTNVMKRYLEIDPVGANREIKIFIQKLELRLQNLR